MFSSPSSAELAVWENWRGKYWIMGSTCYHSVLSDRLLWTRTLLGIGSSSATRSPGRVWTEGTRTKEEKRNNGFDRSILTNTGLFAIRQIPPLCHSSSSGCICPRSDGQPSPTPSAPNPESRWRCDNEDPAWAAPRRTRHSRGLGLLPL